MASKQYKVVLLGEGNTGKTSLFTMFIHGDFNPKHVITVQAGFETKKIVLPNNERVELAIWDTAGQERFHTLGVFYYRNADGAVLVYDVTDANSYDRVQTWVKELHKIVGPDIVLAIVGNKVDLERNRVVPKEKAEAYAASVGAIHYSTSAKLNTGVKELFSDVTRRIVEKEPSVNFGGAAAGGPGQKKKGFLLTPTTEEAEAPPEGGCC